MWKEIRPRCSLNVCPFGMLQRSETVCYLFYLHVASKFASFVFLYNFLYCITDKHFNM